MPYDPDESVRLRPSAFRRVTGHSPEQFDALATFAPAHEQLRQTATTARR